jgi:hypothetical protein
MAARLLGLQVWIPSVPRMSLESVVYCKEADHSSRGVLLSVVWSRSIDQEEAQGLLCDRNRKIYIWQLIRNGFYSVKCARAGKRVDSPNASATNTCFRTCFAMNGNVIGCDYCHVMLLHCRMTKVCIVQCVQQMKRMFISIRGIPFTCIQFLFQ